MPSTRPAKYRREGVRRFRFTREAFERMAEAGVLPPDTRVELINGELIEMSPRNAPHATTLQLLHERLASLVKGEISVRAQAPLELSNVSIPEPDIAIVQGTTRTYSRSHPTSALLVIEVSNSSYAFDSTRKLALYASAGIPEYWIVNLIEQQIEVYSDRSGSDYHTRRTFSRDGALSPSFDTSVRISVADVLP